MCASFAYRAVDWKGGRSRGEMDAPDATAVRHALEARGLVVLDVLERNRARVSLASLRTCWGERRILVEATRAVASLLAAGLPLSRTFETAGDIAGGRVGQALADAVREIERGDSVSDALSRRPRMFSPTYIGVVRAGERSGRLDDAFQRLAELLERKAAIRAELISALVYPAILAVFGLVATVILLLLVIPKFAELLLDAGATLPRSTAILLDLSHLASDLWLPILIALLLAPLAVSRLCRIAGVRQAVSLSAFRIPLIEVWRRHVLAADLSRTLGTLMGGGAPLPTALADVERSTADPLARDELSRIGRRVSEGAALHIALREGRIFPPLLAQLVAVGEESGEIRSFMLRAADLFERRSQRLARRLVTLVEPLLILLFGGLVAIVAFALLQAIYSVNSSVL